MYDGTDLSGCGTVFRLTSNGSLTTLVSFNGTNGKRPGPLLLAKNRNLYGATSEGGKYDKGTIFQIAPNGTFRTLYSFTGKIDDEGIGTLVESEHGDFYGTSVGGKFGCGRIFRLRITPN